VIVNIDMFCGSYTIEDVSDRDIKFIETFCPTVGIMRSFSAIVVGKI
jgi:hypothetical protein